MLTQPTPTMSDDAAWIIPVHRQRAGRHTSSRDFNRRSLARAVLTYQDSDGSELSSAQREWARRVLDAEAAPPSTSTSAAVPPFALAS